jgi:predicted Zn-dependent protease
MSKHKWRRAVWLGYLAGPAFAAPVSQTPQDQQQWLLQQMRVGEAMYRQDLVRDSLARLELIAPEHPQVLVGEVSQVLAEPQDNHRQARLDRLLTQLQTVAPDSPSLRQAKALIALKTPDGLRQLQQARLLAAAGRFEEATAAFEQLFGKEPPDLASALEYNSARSRVPGQRKAVIEQLQVLDQAYPGNAALRQLRVGLYFAENRNDEALNVLHQLAADPQASANAAEREYNYLSKLQVSAESSRAWQTFVRYYPYSPFAKQATEQLASQRQLLADPAWQAGVKAKLMLDQNRDSATAEGLLHRALKRYPQDPSLYGALGTALMRQSKYSAAFEAFTAALAKEQDTDYISKWQDLQAVTRNWMILQRADQALQRMDYAAARQGYQQARTLRPANADPLIGLANVALAEHDDLRAEALLLQARRLEPTSGNIVRALVRLYQRQSNEKVEAFLDSLPVGSQADFAGLRRAIELERLTLQADDAEQHSDGLRLVALLKQMRTLDADSPWLAYRLAKAETTLGHPREADDAFRQLLARQGNEPQARYAHGLFLASMGRDPEVLSTLEHIPVSAWTEEMRELASRIKRRQLLAQADKLRASGQEPAAVALLLRDPTPADLGTLANWAAQRSDQVQAENLYRAVLKRDPGNTEAQLGLIDILIATQRLPLARETLQHFAPAQPLDSGQQRRLANMWTAVGDTAKADALFTELLQVPQSDPLIYRDAARLIAKDHPAQALDRYAQSMAAAGLIAPSQVGATSTRRDDGAMTQASRARDTDDWLARGIRSDVEQLYQQQNPTVNLSHDFAWRTDNTSPGISDLTTQTTILRIDTPVGSGTGFAQAEQVNLQVSDFATDADGLHREAFGTCAVQLRNRATGEAVANGCRSQSQSVSGPSLAVGWKNDQWSFDLGHTPQGFEVGNWLGGVGYSSDWRSIGWTLTASRRPMSNSIVSYAGAIDPMTGTRWGGVTSNGLTLNLSHDEGGVDGVWASLGQHWLVGRNVVSNQRRSAMGGYYYRLVERADERMRTGLTLMYWGYDKDLSEYTLGQGGYYSPQQYYSMGVPFNYAWRNADWSVQLESSLGWSFSKSDSSDLYPLDGPAGKFFARAAAAGLAIDEGSALTSAASSSTGLSISLRGVVERRLSDHWVVGSGISWQHSEGYAPSHAMLYLRYTFDLWRGSLPMPIEPVTPYGDMR